MLSVDAYRIGWKRRYPFRGRTLPSGRRYRWRPSRGPIRRPWQAEVTLADCSCNAKRGFTKAGAMKAVSRTHARAVLRGVCWSASRGSAQ